MRLIDAEELKNMFRWYEKIRLSTNEICKIIDNESTVPFFTNEQCEKAYDEGYAQGYVDGQTNVETVEGTWKYKEYDYYCSNCGKTALEQEDYPYLSSYCPFCGAEMELEQ